jgi:hypothetical protein
MSSQKEILVQLESTAVLSERLKADTIKQCNSKLKVFALFIKKKYPQVAVECLQSLSFNSLPADLIIKDFMVTITKHPMA